MSWIITATVLVVAAFAAIVVDRQIQVRRARTITAKEEAEQTAEAPKTPEEKNRPRLLGGLLDWRKRLGKDKKEQAERFQTWAATNISDTGLRAWLTGLSPEAASALTEQLAEFCINLGFELDWVLTDQLAKDPEIAQHARSVIEAYCLACWRAAQGYNEFETFKTIQDILQAPFARERQELSQRLFAELVKHNMAPSVPAELFVAAEKERQEHMAQAIQQAAETNREGFKQALKDASRVEVEASAQPADAPAAEAASEAGEHKPEAEKPRWRFFGGRKQQSEESEPAEGERTDEHPAAESTEAASSSEPATT